jgi:hypothetical protein
MLRAAPINAASSNRGFFSEDDDAAVPRREQLDSALGE